jgi:hypothetical protein
MMNPNQDWIFRGHRPEAMPQSKEKDYRGDDPQ